MKIKILALFLLTIFAFTGMGCEKEGPAEKAGEKIDEAMNKTGDKVDDAVDEVEEEIDQVQN